MLKIRVIGIEKGEYTSQFFVDGKAFFDGEYIFEDEIEVNAKMSYNDTRFKLHFDFYGELKSICDRSGEDYLEEVEGEYESHFRITQEGLSFVDPDDNDMITLDDNQIVIDEILKQEIILAIPLKRISPKYKNKEFSELHPDYSNNHKEEVKENPAFSSLKKLNFN
ncbi:DUF177 domain-containing protein [Candidatus Kapabacteria bacterium]|nr:DUF177 domain-containing protein [Candidatus Kapabacteria bacterium]